MRQTRPRLQAVRLPIRCVLHRAAALAALIALAFLLHPRAHAADEPVWTYTVQDGDTLIGLGRAYLEDPEAWRVLQVRNRIADPRRLLPGSQLQVPVALLRRKPAPAEIIAVSGAPALTNPRAAVDAPVRVGQQLPVATQIRTGDTDTLTLRFADGSELVIAPRSRIVLDTVSVYAGGGMVDTRVRLQSGRVEARVPSDRPGRKEILTPSAVAAVRGTEFRVAADAGEAISTTEVLDGAVGFSGGGAAVRVPGGFGSRLKTGEPPTPPRALLPPPDLTDAGKLIERLPARIAWQGLPGASAYRVLVTSSTDRLVIDRRVERPDVSIPDLDDGDYRLRARGIDAVSLEGRDATQSFRVHARPFSPLPLKPAPRSSVRDPCPEFAWSRSEMAARYRFQLAREAGFGTLIQDETDVTATSMRCRDPLEAGQYHWRVASVDANGRLGPFTEPQGFTYKPLPAAPSVGASVTRDAIALALPSLAPGEKHEVQIARDDRFERIVAAIEVRDAAAELKGLESGTYYVRIRTVDAEGAAGPYSRQQIDVPHDWRWLYGVGGILLLLLIAL